jgi:hypothetical protein
MEREKGTLLISTVCEEKDAWHQFQCPVRWDEMIDHWLGATPEDDRWLAEYSVASGRYPG